MGLLPPCLSATLQGKLDELEKEVVALRHVEMALEKSQKEVLSFKRALETQAKTRAELIQQQEAVQADGKNATELVAALKALICVSVRESCPAFLPILPSPTSCD